MGEPHIRGAAALAISLEEQGVIPGFQEGDYWQVIKSYFFYPASNYNNI